MYKTTTNLFLDTRKINSEGKYPIKLTIYHRPNKKRYGINIELTKEEWEKINGQRLKDEKLKEVKIKLNSIVEKANSILDDLSIFTFSAFEREFFKISAGDVNTSLQFWFKEYIGKLESEERIGTKISYNTTLNSLEKFRKNIQVTEINKEFLSDYENHMSKSGKSPSTTGIYLRQLRAIVKICIKKGIINSNDYPFKEFEIPSSRNIKKALTDEQLKLLLSYQPKTDPQKLAFDFWVLSYLCNGMNFTDILHLKPENINGNFLFFVRQKTKRTKKKDLRPIKVALHQRAIEIITKWKSKEKQSIYLFNILEKGLSAKTIKNRTQRFIKRVNKYMDEIRIELGFSNKLGTYVARHSFSTRLMRKGASSQFIKESLGHSSVSVTENYLGDFSDSVKTCFTELLTDFE